MTSFSWPKTKSAAKAASKTGNEGIGTILTNCLTSWPMSLITIVMEYNRQPVIMGVSSNGISVMMIRRARETVVSSQERKRQYDANFACDPSRRLPTSQPNIHHDPFSCQWYRLGDTTPTDHKPILCGGIWQPISIEHDSNDNVAIGAPPPARDAQIILLTRDEIIRIPSLPLLIDDSVSFNIPSSSVLPSSPAAAVPTSCACLQRSRSSISNGRVSLIRSKELPSNNKILNGPPRGIINHNYFIVVHAHVLEYLDLHSLTNMNGRWRKPDHNHVMNAAHHQPALINVDRDVYIINDVSPSNDGKRPQDREGPCERWNTVSHEFTSIASMPMKISRAVGIYIKQLNSILVTGIGLTKYRLEHRPHIGMHHKEWVADDRLGQWSITMMYFIDTNKWMAMDIEFPFPFDGGQGLMTITNDPKGDYDYTIDRTQFQPSLPSAAPNRVPTIQESSATSALSQSPTNDNEPMLQIVHSVYMWQLPVRSIILSAPISATRGSKSGSNNGVHEKHAIKCNEWQLISECRRPSHHLFFCSI
jgi:hypothetical protein